MSTDKLDALIERVASEHGIVLSQDDPVLMMHTLNEVLLEQNAKAHAEVLSNYQAILEESFNRWCEYSTKKSNILFFLFVFFNFRLLFNTLIFIFSISFLLCAIFGSESDMSVRPP